MGGSEYQGGAGDADPIRVNSRTTIYKQRRKTNVDENKCNIFHTELTAAGA
jgi:hypothetical protein